MAVRLIVAMFFGAVAGGISAYVRPMIQGPIHYEMLASMFIVLPLIVLALVISMRRTPWRHVTRHLLFAIFATCFAFTAGWAAVQARMWDDMFWVMLVYGLIAAAVAWLLLFVMQYFFPLISGPSCPKCGYSLIGVPRDQCPECGRSFTLGELGITREELQVSDAPRN